MSNTKILVVEDNRIVAEDIKNNLVEMGYGVSAIATSGQKALDAVKTEIPDIAIMDIRLGKGLNGIETATQLWKKYNIPIIYLTAHADAETISRAKVTEPYAYLIKPFDVEELQSAVEIAIYKHKMERRVRESEQWLLTTLKSIGDGVIATDWQARVKFMNPVAERMTGWSQAEATDRPLNEVFHIVNEYSREKFEDPAKTVINTGQSIGLANHPILISRDGTEIPIKDSGAPIVLNNGESIGVVLVFQDDTEARAAEKKLLRNKERLYLAMESANEGLWEWDVVHNTMVLDDLCFQMLGYLPDEVSDSHLQWWIDHIFPDDIPGLRKILADIIDGDEDLFTIDYRVVDKKGECKWVNFRAKIIQRDDAGKPMMVVGIQRDINERKVAEEEKQKLEKKLRQSQKMEAVGTLAGGIAHDFNNILASVIGYTELAMEDTKQTSPVYQNLNEIMVAGLRARDLVRQILVFSRHAESKQKRLSLNKLVGEAVRLMRATIPTSIEIQEEIASKPLMIYANASKIHQILVNLCTNAFHALENNGGTMKIQLDEIEYNEHVSVQFADILPGKYAMITVSDDGKGIEPQHLERIFDPYFTTKDQDKGTGLGLSIVNGIISSHKGYITVNSTPNKGSAFKVYLPIINDQADLCGPSVVQEMPTGKGECLLVVDDEPAIATVQQQNLERLGYVVEVCTSSNDALEKFVKEPAKFDMLITDMAMPKMTGDQLAQRLRAIRPGLPVILCTGFSDKIDRQKCAELNINKFLMKPVKKVNLAKAIRDAFESSSVKH
jgi:PAS domain S-box-containing protein